MNSKGNSTKTLNHFISKVPSRGLLFGALILGALLAFEIFNYSTTDFALTDLLGDLRFAGLRWAAILAIAFCAIDFSGIARLFTPEKGTGELREVWYLFGAWLLAATMNAMLTYWGVTIALLNHTSLGSSVLSQDTLIKVVPIFVAIMVWLIRVLIIGTFSVAGDRLFSQSNVPGYSRPAPRTSQPQPLTHPVAPAQAASFKPLPKTEPQVTHIGSPRPEPTYHSLSVRAAPQDHTHIRK
jgi:hypothetical protein